MWNSGDDAPPAPVPRNGDDTGVSRRSPRSRSAPQHHDPTSPDADVPVEDVYATEELSREELVAELNSLKEENELIKGALRRSNNGASTVLQMHQYHRLQASFDRKVAELKAEAIKFRALESTFAESRNQASVQAHQKDVDLKRALDMLASVRAEVGALKEKSKEDTSLINMLSKENHRLVFLCQDNHISTKDMPPDYVNSIAAVNSARPEKSSAKIPSAKSVLQMSPSNFRKEFLHTSKSKAAHKEVGMSRGASPNAAPRSQTRERSRSANPGINASNDAGGVTTGSCVQWKGMRGTVRYIGTVDPLGAGSWVGVELVEGRGEHSGAAFGRRYFNAPPRSSIFCRISELIPVKQMTPSATTPTTPRNRFAPGTPPSTKSERRKFLSLAYEGEEDATADVPTQDKLYSPTKQLESTIEASPEPEAEPTPEPVVEAAVEPVVEAAVEPTPEPVVETVVESTPEPVVEAAVEPTPELEATTEEADAHIAEEVSVQ